MQIKEIDKVNGFNGYLRDQMGRTGDCLDVGGEREGAFRIGLLSLVYFFL